MKKLKIYSLLLITAVGASSCSYKEDIAKLQKKVDQIEADSDKDGVSNGQDKEARTAEGAKVYGNGFTWDTDGDGVGDMIDRELLSPVGAQVDSLGIAKDDDGDGVPDAKDKELGTPAGAVVNFEGRQASGGAGKVGAGAVPSATAAGKFPTIIFSEAAQIESLSYMGVVEVYNFLAVNPGVKLRIVGHTDNSESTKDVELGQQRADKVIAELMNLGASKDRLVADSKGKSMQSNPVSRLNRRVEFEFIR